MTVADYSRGRPTSAQLRAAGITGVMRYVGTPGNPKNVTAAEYAELTSGGVGVGLVYEAGTGDALRGYMAGVASARAARADADVVGHPRTRPIYLTVDQDVVTKDQFAAVLDYLRGAGSVLGPERVGVYGEYDVTTLARAAGVASWFWQTVAWSARHHDESAHLYQTGAQVTVAGTTADVNNQLRSDYGQYPQLEEDPLSALTDQEQRDLFNRVMGWARQRWYVVNADGSLTEVDAKHPNAVPAPGLDRLDGNYLVGLLEQLLTTLGSLGTSWKSAEAELLAAIGGLRDGTADAQAIADKLLPLIGPEVADELSARLAQ